MPRLANLNYFLDTYRIYFTTSVLVYSTLGGDKRIRTVDPLLAKQVL